MMIKCMEFCQDGSYQNVDGKTVMLTSKNMTTSVVPKKRIHEKIPQDVDRKLNQMIGY